MADPIELLTSKIDALAQGMTAGFAGVDRRLDGIDSQLRDIPAHFTELRSYIDMGLEKTQTTMKGDIARVERKLDQFIDSELRR